MCGLRAAAARWPAALGLGGAVGECGWADLRQAVEQQAQQLLAGIRWT